MSSFTITMRDSTNQIIESLEAAMRNAGDWSKFWEDKNGRISKLWAKSRQDMFATEGASTGPAWPKYTRQEQRYWLPIKRWSLGVKTIQTGGILRWTKSPRSGRSSARKVVSVALLGYASAIHLPSQRNADNAWHRGSVCGQS